MEKFNLMDFIAKLGKAYLSEENKKPQEQTFSKGQTETAPKDNAPKPQKQSDSQKALAEMLRRHDVKAREIAEKNKQN